MFGTVDIKLRPLRLAYLVDPGNADQVREAIRLSSTLWGGAYSPIIQLYKRMPASWRDRHERAWPAKAVALGYLEAFDPDIVVQLGPEIPPYITQTRRKIIKGEEIWQSLEQRGGLAPRYGIGVFELLNGVYEEYFKYKAKYAVKVILPRVPQQLSLFWASLFGELPPRIGAVVEGRYAEAVEIEAIDFVVDRIAEVMEPRVLFPRRLTQIQLQLLGRSGFRGDASVYFLDAEKVDDIVDFWNLRATGRQVLAVPKQLQETPALREILVEFLKENRRHWDHQPSVCDQATMIRSRHSTIEELQEFAKTVKIERPPNDPSQDGFFSLQHWYPRIWDEWARGRDGVSPRDTYSDVEDSVDIHEGKNFTVRLKPLLPAFADEYALHAEARCANEISFRFYGSPEYLAEVFPQSSGEHLDRAVSGIIYRGDWRTGRHGLVRLVTHDAAETRELPTAESILFAWLRDMGWTPELSAPGLLAKAIYRKLEGHVSVLAKPKLLGLFERMNGGRVAADDSPLEEQTDLEQERDLTVGEVRQRIEQISKKGNLYDYLLSKGIFRLGLRVRCPHCSRHSWFDLENIRALFTCPKCLEPFPAAGNMDNSRWAYKTTGPFSVPHHADGAYGVLLALQCFDDRHMTTMRVTPALSFTAKKGNQELEADFALFWQESVFGMRQEGIAFGECKTYRRFKPPDFERMSQIAEAFPGAVLVFSTLRDSLTKTEVAAMKRIARAGRKYWKAERPINPVMILTGTELLSWRGMPHCWSPALQEKFRHIHGLLKLCDATQQIYLGLPSWEVEWHERWDKRWRRLRQATPEGAVEPVPARPGSRV